MKVTGRVSLEAPREAVFAAICDPAALLDVIPGCEEIREVAPGEYRGRIAIRLPAIVGTYETQVRLGRTDPPTCGELEGRVEGRVGSLAGTAAFRLTARAPERTLVEYEGEAQVSGPLARLDARFLEGIARSLVDQGLSRLEARLRTGAVSATAHPKESPT